MSEKKQHSEFELIKIHEIHSLKLELQEYKHKKTGAQHFHLAAENPENVFLVALRTVPMDSRGAAHILEHTALCGSKRYPVRDPFFMMIRRSLNTFMNAFTSSDWTAYPFASQNKKDFNNLLDVYLDAVFFPNIKEEDFLQEGWRVEFSKLDDPTTDLIYKGVVFNEMKGAMSAPTSILWHTLCKYVYPTTTYHYNSGGDPESIPDLSHEQLKAFYKKHYHPSNAIFMTYGDIPAAEHQQHFHDLALKHFSQSNEKIFIQDEQRYLAPIEVEESYPLEEGSGDISNKTHIVLAWLLGSNVDQELLFQTNLLSSVLLDNSASPLRKALETTKLGAAPSSLCGLEDSMHEILFSCGLEGSNPEQATAVEELILKVLRDVAEHGIEKEKLEAALHQLELSQREISGGGYPYGLQLLLNGLTPAIHYHDPISVLDIDPVIEKLRKQIQDPNFIKQLVSKLLLDNTHRVRLVLKPDAQMGQRAIQEEAKKLSEIKSKLNDTEKKKIVEQAKTLQERQRKKQNADILPKVTLHDVPPNLKIPSGHSLSSQSLPMMYYPQGTNGIVYQDIVIDLPEFNEELLEILPHMVSCMGELGCAGKDYLEVQDWQARVSGGVGASLLVRSSIDNPQQLKGQFTVSGKALTRNHGELTNLLYETLETTRFDEVNRIQELMAQMRVQKEQSVTGNGHNYAMMAAASGMSSNAALSQRWYGLPSILFLKTWDEKLKDPKYQKLFSESMASIHEKIKSMPREFLLIGEEENQKRLIQDINAQWGKSPIEKNHYQTFNLSPVHHQVKQCWVASTQVNFCAKSYPTVPIEHPDAAALTILASFMRNGFLHRVIREEGGAYGGGASHDPDNASFQFYSYRDPRLTETLTDFDRAIDWVLNEKHEASQLEEAVLNVVAAIDKPSSPAGEAKKAFYNSAFGRTPEQRMRYRQRILQVTLDDLVRVASMYLKPEKASVAVITSRALQEKCESLGMEVFAL
ncbi:MAG: insulinase family protein [Proteobacteria bacterium]|nr:insulinase family protein [Pseudomonadota bacterium]